MVVPAASDRAVRSTAMMDLCLVRCLKGYGATVKLAWIEIAMSLGMVLLDAPLAIVRVEATGELAAVMEAVEAFVVVLAGLRDFEGFRASFDLAARASAVVVCVMFFDVPAAGESSVGWQLKRHRSG